LNSKKNHPVKNPQLTQKEEMKKGGGSKGAGGQINWVGRGLIRYAEGGPLRGLPGTTNKVGNLKKGGHRETQARPLKKLATLCGAKSN